MYVYSVQCLVYDLLLSCFDVIIGGTIHRNGQVKTGGLRKFAMNDNNYDRIRDSLNFSSQTMGSGLLAHTPTDTALWMLFYSRSFV